MTDDIQLKICVLIYDLTSVSLCSHALQNTYTGEWNYFEVWDISHLIANEWTKRVWSTNPAYLWQTGHYPYLSLNANHKVISFRKQRLFSIPFPWHMLAEPRTYKSVYCATDWISVWSGFIRRTIHLTARRPTSSHMGHSTTPLNRVLHFNAFLSIFGTS